MLKRSCRTFVIALSASAFLTPLAPALAGQTHGVGSLRLPDFGTPRNEPANVSHPGLLVAPLQPRPLEAAADTGHTTPSFVPFVPVHAYPAFWPEFGFASMFGAGSNWYGCTATRSALFVPAYLPATVSPFASPACGQDWSAVGDADGITTLTPGQNKDALYGPAYNPHDFGTP